VICPFCAHNDDKVIDSRASEGGKTIRRRRECLKCQRRFTTYERVEESARIVVVKRDGTRQPFDRDKITRAVAAACGKRPIPEDRKKQLVDTIEDQVYRDFEREVPSSVIGEAVCQKLKDLDEVAYIRFASVYHRFRDVGELAKELADLANRVKDVPDQARLFGPER
jgi:transcriptional repressor NrdR